jgi:hypothetical protein
MEKLLISVSLLALAACGGGGGGGSSATNSIVGVAAVGAPIDGTVSIKDSIGTTKQVNTNPTTGEFTIDTTSLIAPFILRAQKSNGDFLYSSSITTGIANINPLSNLVLANVSRTIGAGKDQNSLYQAFSTYASQVTKIQLDKSTADIYDSLSTGFKAKLGSSDFNPIYAPFSIGNTLDKAFDEIGIVYDSNSGYFQEKDLINLKFQMFGTLGKIKNIGFISGNYTGLVTVGNNSRAIFSSIDDDGEVVIYINSDYVYYGKLVQNGNTANGVGVLYKLDANGLSSYTPQTAKSISINVALQSDILLITFADTLDNSPATLNLSPTVSGTYGNNLLGTRSDLTYSKLGPFSTSDGEGLLNGSNKYSNKLYFKDTTLDNSRCDANHAWTLQLSDLEHSIYSISFSESVTSTYPGNQSLACTSPYLGQNYETVGGGFFTSSGLYAFLVDKASMDNTNYEYAFVAVKLFNK